MLVPRLGGRRCRVSKSTPGQGDQSQSCVQRTVKYIRYTAVIHQNASLGAWDNNQGCQIPGSTHNNQGCQITSLTRLPQPMVLLTTTRVARFLVLQGCHFPGLADNQGCHIPGLTRLPDHWLYRFARSLVSQGCQIISLTGLPQPRSYRLPRLPDH